MCACNSNQHGFRFVDLASETVYIISAILDVLVMKFESGDVAPVELVGGMADAADCPHEIIYCAVARDRSGNYGHLVRSAWVVWLDIY